MLSLSKHEPVKASAPESLRPAEADIGPYTLKQPVM
jgi:hypothetical protein